ncbi:MAG: DUF2975 domain-containing protein [Flavobacteriales bacterium]|nr:DUF2975 domain-containing protein [Flavobacteriales bacterium]
MHINLKSTKSKSIGLLYLISKLSFWFSIIFSLVISSVLLYGTFGNNIPLKVSLETNNLTYEKDYSFNSDNKDILETEDITSRKYPIQSLKRKLVLKYQAFHKSPLLERLTILFLTLLLLIIIVLSTYYAKEFMRAINDGEYFERATINKLRIISYLLFSVWIVKLVSSSVLKLFWVKEDVNPIANIHLSNNFPSINLLLFSLMLWVLSYVFLKGVSLKEENELTV